MTPHEQLKLKLRVSVLLASKSISEQQLEQAAILLEGRVSLVKKASVTDLEAVGLAAANDRTIFASTDIDDINNLLGSIGNK